MARIKLRDLNLPPPPCCPAWCESGAAEIVDHLVKKHNAEPWQVKYVIGFLNESYILSLPRLRYDTHDQSDTSPKRLRWLFYSWTAQILGWTQRRQEGDDDGLSPLVYRVIREVVYPYSKVERPTATPLAYSTLFIGHAVHEDPSLSASRGAWSCTDILKQGDIPKRWAQQFQHKGDIDSKGFTGEEGIENKKKWVVQVWFYTFLHLQSKFSSPSLIVFKYLTLTSLPKKQVRDIWFMDVTALALPCGYEL